MKYLLLTLLVLSVNSYSATNEPHPVIDSNYNGEIVRWLILTLWGSKFESYLIGTSMENQI